MKINVAGHEVLESTSERLIGLIVNNTMTWEHQLYGTQRTHLQIIPKSWPDKKIIICYAQRQAHNNDRSHICLPSHLLSLAMFGAETFDETVRQISDCQLQIIAPTNGVQLIKP